MQKDTWKAASLEAGLLFVSAALGCVFRSPLIFTSLGPTAYEMIEMPHRPSARPYNILMGHLVGIVSGLAALGMTHAWTAPAVSLHGLTWSRAWAVLLAGFMTVAGTLLLRATQPAALSTTLLVALGTMQTWHGVWNIALSVCLITALGEPIRRWRLQRPDAQRG